MRAVPALLVEQLAVRVAELLGELAKLLAAELAAVPPAPPPTARPETRQLLTLDELIALLPAGKKPATWKAWLYQRTRLGDVPGCHKIGGRLFFQSEATLPWILAGATRRQTPPRLDLQAEPSLHAQSMPDLPGHRRQGVRE